MSTQSSPEIAQLAADARRIVSAWRSPSTWTALAATAGALVGIAWPGGLSGDVRDVVAAAGALVVSVWSVVHGADHRHAVAVVAQRHKSAAEAVPTAASSSPPPLVSPTT